MNHSIVFTGHRIDDPGRKKPRFPQSSERIAANAIEREIRVILKQFNGSVVGIAGGASGGDILFHECCKKLGVQSQVFLALPKRAFIRQSVTVPGTPGWVQRFEVIIGGSELKILTQDPDATVNQERISIWERNNQWILDAALANGGANATLIALWNGEQGDGSGGTQHMVKQAEISGARTIILEDGLAEH